MSELLKYRCLHKKKSGGTCGHEWTPDSEKPVSCPKCKTYIDWSKPEEYVEIVKTENKK